MSPVSSAQRNGREPLTPLWVGVAIFLLPPLGIYLLWKHPVLGQSGAWRKAAYAWCAVWCIAQVSNAVTGEREKTAGRTTHANASSAQTSAKPDAPQRSPESDEVAQYLEETKETRNYEAAYSQGYADAKHWRNAVEQARQYKDPALVKKFEQVLAQLLDKSKAAYRETPTSYTRGMYEGAQAAAGPYAR